MRGVLKIIFGVSLVAGPFVLFAAYQLQQAQAEAGPTPQTLTMAEFAEQGPAASAHLELTEVHFGKPLAMKSDGQRVVWLPMYAAAPPEHNPPPPVAVLRVGNLKDKAADAEFAQRASATALVSGRMPSPGPWNAVLPSRFAKLYPGLKPEETAVLVEPTVSLGQWSWGPEVVFDPNTLLGAWGLGGVLLGVGLLGTLWLSRGEPKTDETPTSQPQPQKAVAAAGILGPQASEFKDVAAEPTVSHHVFNRWEFAARSFKLWAYIIVTTALLALVMIGGLLTLRRNPSSGLTIIMIDTLLFAINGWIFYYNHRFSLFGVAEIEVCPSGLRWRKTEDGPLHTARWGDITDLNIVAVNVVGQGVGSGWRLEMRITFRSGDKLVFAPFSLTEYVAFTKLVAEGYKHGGVMSGAIQSAAGRTSYLTAGSK
jgi:hypothetical protein